MKECKGDYANVAWDDCPRCDEKNCEFRKGNMGIGERLVYLGILVFILAIILW